MKKISILGCGWLGFPLAKVLIENHFDVKGSTTSNEKMAILENSDIEPFLISVSENGIEGNISDFLKDSELLIIDIPPKLRGVEKENFVSKIQNVITFVEKSSVENVIFISSTSVYTDNNSIVDEGTTPNPETESGKQLWQSEQILQSNLNFKTTIIRFGGLIGNDRNPAKSLSGKTNVESPDAPINFIHQEDCIGIILKIIETEKWKEIFNAVAPFHPSRKEYYEQKTAELHLPAPQFNFEDQSTGKTISSEKVERFLKYSFTFPQL